MKKFLLIAAMAVAGLTATAQVEPGFRMGARINLGLNEWTGNHIESKMSFAYGANFVAEYNVNSNFYVQSGLGFNNLPEKLDIDGAKAVNGWYIGIPVQAGYRFNLTESMPLFVQAGPEFAFGVGGTKGRFDDPFKKFEVDLGARVGVEISKIQISLAFNYGLTEIAKSSKVHNMNFGIGVGYMF